MNRQYPTAAGFRIKVAKDADAATQLYHKAFLPLAIAHKCPEVLLLSGLEYDELERVPGTGKFVVGAGQIVERSKGKPEPTAKGSGCGAVLVCVAAMIVFAVWATLSGYAGRFFAAAFICLA